MRRRTLLAGLVLAGSMTPTAVWAREAVAELFGQAIYRDELAEPEALGERIIQPLVQRFVDAQRLEPTETEIADVRAWMKDTMAQEGKEPIRASDASERQQLRELLAGIVLSWKINKALYEHYGGEVIFQQFAPREAVGAMRQFLEDQEASGTFKIFDAAERERFYAYYRRRNHPGGFVPPEKVDYSVPWWRQKPR